MRRRVWAGVLWVLAIGWLGLCFYLSWQTGEQTAGLSQWLAGALLRLLAKVNLRPDPTAFHQGLRTAAHVGAFLGAGALLGGALAVSAWEKRRWARITFLGGMVACSLSAAAAEIAKRWIPGRHLQWDELGLNLLGALLGVGGACLIALIARKRRDA